MDMRKAAKAAGYVDSSGSIITRNNNKSKLAADGSGGVHVQLLKHR